MRKEPLGDQTVTQECCSTMANRRRIRSKRVWLAVLIVGLASIILVSAPWRYASAHGHSSRELEPTSDAQRASLTGRLVDPTGEPVDGATVVLYINGRPVESGEEEIEVESALDGAFVLDLPQAHLGSVEALALKISRPHFSSLEWQATEQDLAKINQSESLRLADMTIERRITPAFWIAALTFVAILTLVALDKLHTTMAALLGVAIILGVSSVGGTVNPDFFVFDFERAIEYVNFDVIFLVMGMMIVIGVIEGTGIFQWLAYQAYRLSGGRAWLLVTILMLLTAVASALLDNVTTMLLMTPITIQIALAMEVAPLSLLIPEVLASNVGGISTLIGTPTNILIGAYADLSFNDFLVNLTPGVLLALALLTGYVLLRYRTQFLQRGGGLSETLLERLRESGRITQPDKLRMSGFIFAIMLILFVLGERIHLAPAVTAIIGAVAMLLWVTPDIESMLKVVDWTTLVFFISLFIVVGAIQEVGVISLIATAIGDFVGDNLTVAVLVVVWSSALLSGVIANIPFTAAMLPVIGYLSATIPGASNNVLYYSLSVGSAMGGNGTLIGASANLVTAGIADRAGYRITYANFFKIGFPAMILTVCAGTLWLLFRF
jgi:Na+/H+ antiporter NhaD/arsenite permease-like protein